MERTTWSDGAPETVSIESVIAEAERASMQVIANAYLLESLLSNLLMNAIRHNVSKGMIEIFLADGILSIRNTGPTLTKPAKILFERFIKDDASAPSTGLGLAIVKEICLQHGWWVSYTSNGVWHEVKVRFDQPPHSPGKEEA